MAEIPIHGVGRYGVIYDQPAHELPPEAWSDGRNVRFESGKILQSGGFTPVYGDPTVNPYWTMFCPGLAENYWLYAGAAKVYVTNQSGTHTDITRTVGGDYSMDNDILWNGGILGGIPVINNGIDTPQYWSTISSGTKLANLTNWPTDYKCRVMRPFKNFLVALDITDNLSARFPHRVKWSHSADPGTIPSSWDASDATKDAGEVDLTDVARGFIIDARTLGDVMIIYKQASIWGMQFIGGQFIFRFYQIIDGVGMYTKHCSCLVGSRGVPRHFVFTGDDLIVHDGRTLESVLDRRMRHWLLSIMSSDKLLRAFCQTNFAEKECWFCFPTEGSDWADLAIAWNWEENTLCVRDIGEASYIGIGDVTETTAGSGTWATDSDTWDSDSTLWGGAPTNPNELRMLQTAPVTDKLFKADSGTNFNGVGMTSYVERTGLAIAGKDNSGALKVDYQKRKFVQRIWPRIKGGPVQVRLGTQDDSQAAVMWSSPQTFDPTSQDYLDFEINGRLISVRIDTMGGAYWECEGYDLDVVLAGVI